MSKIKVSAVVRMTIEIPLHQSWDGKCSIEQIQKQAVEDAESILCSHKLVFDGLVQGAGVITHPHPVQLLESKTKIFIVEEE